MDSPILQLPPSLYRLAACYRSGFLVPYFEPEAYPQKSGSCQFLESRFLHRTLSDIGDSVYVSVSELLSFTASGRGDQCKDHSNSRPVCQYTPATIPNRKHLFPPICPVLCSPVGESRIFWFSSRQPGMTALKNPRLSCQYLSPRLLNSPSERALNASA